MTRYTVVVHPTGCRIIEGESVPVGDYAALLTLWGKETDDDKDDPVLISTDLPERLMARSAVHVVSVVGRKSQLDALGKLFP